MKTVLIVDDARTDRELAGGVVRRLGHHVEYAADGEEALRVARALKPALILLDIVMPRQDGFATCRSLKRDAETTSIPVVLISSKNSEADRFWGEKQGAAGYVAKPYTPDALSEVVARFV